MILVSIATAPGSLKPDGEEQQGEMKGPKASETTQHAGANGASRSKLVHVSVSDDQAAQNEKEIDEQPRSLRTAGSEHAIL